MNEMRRRTRARAAVEARRGSATRMAGLVVLTAVLGITGFLAASAFAGGAASQTNATLSLRRTNLGQILVSARGRTLYLFMLARIWAEVSAEEREVIATRLGEDFTPFTVADGYELPGVAVVAAAS